MNYRILSLEMFRVIFKLECSKVNGRNKKTLMEFFSFISKHFILTYHNYFLEKHSFVDLLYCKPMAVSLDLGDFLPSFSQF